MRVPIEKVAKVVFMRVNIKTVTKRKIRCPTVDIFSKQILKNGSLIEVNTTLSRKIASHYLHVFLRL